LTATKTSQSAVYLYRRPSIKVLALLDSSYDGEALTAARLAARLVNNANLSWDDVIRGAGRDNRPIAASEPAVADWRRVISIIERSSRVLAPWEHQFINALKQLSRISDKQRRALGVLCRKVAMYHRSHPA
ncbi:MAG: hypothetical protein WCF85_19310, partial [Rhodospirillaceae bacterium]